MKNMFNKANAPYLIASALAIGGLLASGVFAVSPYVGFLVPVAAWPFIIGVAVLSVAIIALLAITISKNNAIFQQMKFENRVAQRKEEEAKARNPVPEVIALPYKDTEASSPENQPAGVDLDYLDLAAPSNKQEQQANKNVDYLDLATSKDLNHLNVQIMTPKMLKNFFAALSTYTVNSRMARTYSLIHKGRDTFKDETNGIRKISEHVRYLSNIVLNLKPIVLNRIEVRRVSGQI